MRVLTLSVFLLSSASFAQSSRAEWPAAGTPEALLHARDHQIQLRMQGSNAFSLFGLQRYGGRVDLGFWGDGADELFAGSSGALELAKGMRRSRVIGISLYAASLVVLVADIVGFVVFAANAREDRVSATAAGFLIGGAVVGGVLGSVAGAFFQKANTQMVDAVNRYNLDLLNNALPEGQRVPPSTVAGRGVLVNALSLAF